MKKEKTFLIIVMIVFLSAITSGVAIAETNEVLINEFVSMPQQDWDGNNATGAGDEWIELYNPGIASIELVDWQLRMIDSDNATQTVTGTIPAGGYLVVQNPSGQLDTDGRVELYDASENLIDSVTYGDYNDGETSDNAPNGESDTPYNECLSRYPNGADTGNDSDDFIKSLCSYQSANNFSYTPINITDYTASPTCALETDDVTVRADIFGSISEASVFINTNGTWEQIILPGNSEGQYIYTIPSSRLEGDTIIQWQFSVLDVIENTTTGQVGSLPINAITQLDVFPEDPTGINGWYVTEPQFELSNPSATEILYRWNGVSFTYAAPFGLEGTPNGGNVTGGTHMLYYNSNVCNEPESTFMGRFDFKNPEIENLYPAPGSIAMNEQPTTISAYIDEVYQGNSGVNLSSVTMEINGNPVDITIEPSGPLDAIVVFEGNLTDGEYDVMIYAEDNSGRSSSTSWAFELVTPSVFSMDLFLPKEEIYQDRRIQFNISLSREAEELLYMNENDPNPRFKRLCRDCDGFGFDKTRFKSLREGENDLIFQAVNGPELIEQSLSLTIDSREPRIKRTEPRSGLASGTFEIEFDEDNPSELKLIYGNFDSGFEEYIFDMETECDLDRTYFCSTNIDLSDYDGTEIEYYISLEDVAGNIDESNTRKLDVDIAGPAINSFDLTVDGRFVTFTLDVTESYLDEITYIENLDQRPRERRLCNSLQDGICQKRVSFGEGDHEVEIKVKDEAGNEATRVAEFFTDSREPRIKRTEPRRGFASGKFEVTFEEVNPLELFINYGTPDEMRNAQLDLSSCTPDRKNTVCSISLNLTDFEEQEITYWFNITDIVKNFDESRPVDLDVDTLPPEITESNYSISENELIYRIGVEDPNFEKVVYQDREDSNPRFRTLCSRLDEGICEGDKRFRRGLHTIDIKAYDEAGNEIIIEEGIVFEVF